MLEIERGSTRSHLVEKSLWQRLWTCLQKTDCVVTDDDDGGGDDDD
jgi:hypothetical protein